MDIQISLCISQLILHVLKLTIIYIFIDFKICKTQTGNFYKVNLEPD